MLIATKSICAITIWIIWLELFSRLHANTWVALLLSDAPSSSTSTSLFSAICSLITNLCPRKKILIVLKYLPQIFRVNPFVSFNGASTSSRLTLRHLQMQNITSGMKRQFTFLLLHVLLFFLNWIKCRWKREREADVSVPHYSINNSVNEILYYKKNN